MNVKIGNYNILNTVGSGTFGKVKLAVHSYTGIKVALKILNRRRIVNLNMVQRLKREVQYLQVLSNPHIIKLYEVITTPTDIILVLEYAGGELFNYIVEKGRMSEGEARKLFQQIITAVEHCHFHKIVHRDLKPENILLDNQKNVKIADFGLSNYLEDGDFLKTSCGSPNYAAPEVISGKLYAGPEIDVWSCGVILYVMLCGQLPFDDDHIPTLFKKINSGVFRMPSFLSTSAKDILSAMLVVDPLKRITIQEIRKNSWFSKDLPLYLYPTAYLTEKSPYAEMNETIVQELSKKMKFSLNTILHALNETENNQIQVGYRLMIDSLPIERTTSKANDPIIAALKDVHIASFEKPNGERSSVQIITNSIPPPREETLESRKMRTTRSRWHYGIRSRSDPFEIMNEIYNALSRTSLKWKSMDPCRIRCLDTSPVGNEVKFEIQLYKIEPGNYLVDFKKLNNHNASIIQNDANAAAAGSSSTGQHSSSSSQQSNSSSVFSFFNACAKLIAELAVQN